MYKARRTRIGTTEQKILDILKHRYYESSKNKEISIKELIPLVYDEKPVTTSQEQVVYRAIRTLHEKGLISVAKNYRDFYKKRNHRGGYKYSKIVWHV